MRKKVTPKSRQPKSHKTVGHYLHLYVLSVATAFVVFLLSNVLMPVHNTIPCANTQSCQSDLTQQIDNNAVGTFQGHTVVPPKIDLASERLLPNVLGDNTPAGEKHIYVDLSTQTLYAMQGDSEVIKTFISSGKWNPTPVGNFKIWEKLRATRMKGGEGADAYDLPNVPYVMYFYQDYGLHGAYWHNNFGHAMSHGCINERLVDARDVYNWAEVGTPVSVCNSFSEPNNCVQEHPVN